MAEQNNFVVRQDAEEVDWDAEEVDWVAEVDEEQDFLDQGIRGQEFASMLGSRNGEITIFGNPNFNIHGLTMEQILNIDGEKLRRLDSALWYCFYFKKDRQQPVRRSMALDARLVGDEARLQDIVYYNFNLKQTLSAINFDLSGLPNPIQAANRLVAEILAL